MKRSWYIVLLLFLALSCNGPRRISRSDMENIYHDMFLLDQQIRYDFTLRRIADTSLVYENIFRTYGYERDDYIYSVNEYIKEPEKFSKVFANVADRLTREADDIKKQEEFEQWKNSLMAIYGRSVDTTKGPRVPKDIIDSLHFRLVGPSVEFFPPEDTLAWDLDTLVFTRDTVALAPADSLDI